MPHPPPRQTTVTLQTHWNCCQTCHLGSLGGGGSRERGTPPYYGCQRSRYVPSQGDCLSVSWWPDTRSPRVVVVWQAYPHSLPIPPTHRHSRPHTTIHSVLVARDPHLRFRSRVSPASAPSPPPPPLRKHGRGPKSQVQTAVQRPPRAETRPCMRATHVTANVWGRPQMGMARGCKWGRALYQKRHCPFRMYPPPRVQEPAMFDRGTRGWFLRTLSPLNLTAEPGVGSCAQPWATPYRGKKIFRRVAPGHACPLLSHS